MKCRAYKLNARVVTVRASVLTADMVSFRSASSASRRAFSAASSARRASRASAAAASTACAGNPLHAWPAGDWRKACVVDLHSVIVSYSISEDFIISTRGKVRRYNPFACTLSSRSELCSVVLVCGSWRGSLPRHGALVVRPLRSPVVPAEEHPRLFGFEVRHARMHLPRNR